MGTWVITSVREVEGRLSDRLMTLERLLTDSIFTLIPFCRVFCEAECFAPLVIGVENRKLAAGWSEASLCAKEHPRAADLGEFRSERLADLRSWEGEEGWKVRVFLTAKGDWGLAGAGMNSEDAHLEERLACDLLDGCLALAGLYEAKVSIV